MVKGREGKKATETFLSPSEMICAISQIGVKGKGGPCAAGDLEWVRIGSFGKRKPPPHVPPSLPPHIKTDARSMGCEDLIGN